MEPFAQRVQQKRQETVEQQNRAAIARSIQEAPRQTATELATLLAGNDPRLLEAAQHLVELLQAVQEAAGGLQGSGLALLPEIHQQFVDALEKIPERVAETDKSPALIPYLKQMVTAIKSQELNPIIQVDAPDTSALEQAVNALEEALKSPTKLDTEKLEDKLDKIAKGIRDLIKKPMPVATFPTNSDGSVRTPGLISGSYDYISASYPSSTTEEYVFKRGGSGGSTVATVTVVYTDASKENLSTVTRV